jgi:toxin FitB
MKFLVDANVLSEATKPRPNPNLIAWLAAHETELAINPIILGELRFGILLLPKSKR